MAVAPQKLKRVPFDKRYYSHARTFGAPAISLPAEFTYTPISIKDQGYTSYCTAFSTTAASEYQEGIELSEEYTTAKIGEVAGAPIIDGAQPTDALTSGIDYGYLPKEQSPLSFERDGWTFPADWRNFPPILDGQSIMHRKDSYYKVSPTYDKIKEAIFQAREDKGVVVAMGFWYSNFNEVGTSGIVTIPVSSPITRHAYLYTGWKVINGTEYLVAQLSQGKGYGDGGLLYFSREVINAAWKNALFNGIGCFIYRDDTGQHTEEVLTKKYYRLIDLLGQLLDLLRGR